MSHRGNRRAALAEAAIAVLARDGGRGLTHRAVDREAGFPEGTAKNYYLSPLLRIATSFVSSARAQRMLVAMWR